VKISNALLFRMECFVSSSVAAVKVNKSQKHFFLKLHCPKNEQNI